MKGKGRYILLHTLFVGDCHEGFDDLCPLDVLGAVIFIHPAEEAAGYAVSTGLTLVTGRAVNTGEKRRIISFTVYVSIHVLNPSSAEATFVQSTRMKRYLKNI